MQTSRWFIPRQEPHCGLLLASNVTLLKLALHVYSERFCLITIDPATAAPQYSALITKRIVSHLVKKNFNFRQNTLVYITVENKYFSI
jgi:hypothetical protein